MKKAHRYNLKVEFNNGTKWDIDIIAVTAECLSMWLPKEETKEAYILSVNITLVQRDFTNVKSNFLAKGV